MEKTIEEIHGNADAVEKIELFYYRTKEWEKEQGYSVFCEQYRGIAGQGKTKEEAFDNWIEIMHIYNTELKK